MGSGLTRLRVRVTDNRSGLGVASAVAVLAIWSSFILIGRLNATGGRVLLPLDIAFLRFAFSGLGVLVIAAVRVRRAPPGLPREPRHSVR